MTQKKQRSRRPLAEFMGTGDNRESRASKLRLLYRLIDRILTERQRFCITAYYGEGRTQAEIAQELSINVSSVSRHIKAGRRRLQTAVDCLQETKQ